MNGNADYSVHHWLDVTPQIAFSSTGKIPNRNKNNSSIKSNKCHSKYVCFGSRKTRKERKIALKFTSSAFLRPLWWSMRQRSLAMWFHSQLWLVHLNLSARLNSTVARAQIEMDQMDVYLSNRPQVSMVYCFYIIIQKTHDFTVGLLAQ